ncbi:MAG: GYF domain-containing protein [Planctomycetota bacterium]
MTGAVPVECRCGELISVAPTELGHPRICEACGRSFLAWPREEDVRRSAPPTWFVRVGDHELGPFHRAEIDRLVAEGRVQRDTQVRRDREDPWIAAAEAGLVDRDAPVVATPVAAPLPVAAPIAEPVPVVAPLPPGGTRARTRRRSARPAAVATAPRSRRTTVLAVVVAVAIVGVGLGAWAALRSGSGEGEGAPLPVAADGTAGDGPTTPCEPPRALDEATARAAASVVRVKGRHGQAAGFVVAPGVVATSRRMLADERLEDVRLEPAGPGAPPPTLLYVDPELDLAFLDLDGDGQPISLATKVTLAPGTEVGLLAYPPDADVAAGPPLLTKGACRARVLVAGRPHNLIEIPADSPCSGCPVLDTSGDAIGMVTCVAAAESGQCVFIPLSSIKSALDHALALPEEERQRVAVHHGLARLARRIWRATKALGEVGQETLATIRESIARGEEPAVGLAAAKEQREAKLQAVDAELPAGMSEELDTVLASPSLHPLTVRRMKRLHAAYEGLRAHLADPPTTLSNYNRRQEHWAYEANTAGRELLEADGIRIEGE